MSANAERKKLITGAALLAIGGFLSRLIGGIYRIPLMGILGAEGMGVYQLVFPLYSLLLTVSSSGVPIVISKVIAEFTAKHGGEPKGFTAKCMLFFGGGALVLGILLAVFSGTIAAVQGSMRVRMSYIAIAPAVFAVALISVVRGVFQGRQNMLPTALSQIVEQVVKVPLGLVLAKLFMPNMELAVFGVTIAITISEIAALGMLLISYRFKKKKVKRVDIKFSFKEMFKQSFSVTAGAVVLPITQLIDSVLVINLISRYMSGSEAMYGILSGGVFSLINLPVGIASSIAVSLVPHLAKKFAVGEKSSIDKPLVLTLLVAVPCFLAYLTMSGTIVGALYPSLAAQERLLMSQLLSLSSVNILLLCLNQLFTSTLQSCGKAHLPALSILCGAIVKLTLSAILLSIPAVNIFGAVISANACYLLATILNLVYIIRSGKNSSFSFKTLLFPIGVSIPAMACMYVVVRLLGGFWGLLLGGLAALSVYIIVFGIKIVRRSK